MGSASIHSHLKMDGSWQVNPIGEPSRGGHRIGSFCRRRRAGRRGRPRGAGGLDRDDEQDAVGHLGPDLLGDDWDPHTAAANLTADPDRPLAEALLDQRVIAGVGNVCNELSLRHRLPPTTGHGGGRPAAHGAAGAGHAVAQQVSVEQNHHRRHPARRRLWVYGRAGQPCQRCGTIIGSDSGDRISFWCPVCQR